MKYQAIHSIHHSKGILNPGSVFEKSLLLVDDFEELLKKGAIEEYKEGTVNLVTMSNSLNDITDVNEKPTKVVDEKPTMVVDEKPTKVVNAPKDKPDSKGSKAGSSVNDLL